MAPKKEIQKPASSSQVMRQHGTPGGATPVRTPLSRMARTLKRQRISKKQPATPGGTPRGAQRRKPRTIWEPGNSGTFDSFSVHVRDAELRQRLNVALEKKRLRSARSGKRQAVHWDSCREVTDGFALRWQEPVLFRAGYHWWYLLMQQVGGGRGAFKVVPHAKSPDYGAGVAPPGAQQASTERTAASSSAASSALCSTELPAASSRADASTFSWPRFKTRRLLGHTTGEQGIGGSASMYKQGAFLGRGTFGKVHKCTLGGLELAVKVFQKEKLWNALAEASVAEQVAGHPHLVRLVDGIVDPATKISYLVYEFAGADLTQHLSEASSVDMRRLARQTLAGLAHLHSMGLFHSDLKPPNILVLPLSEGGAMFRVADLGGVTEVGLGSKIRLDGSRTTLNYRAPEVLLGQKCAAGEQWLRADIWAVGMVLCEALGLKFHLIKVRENESDERQTKLMLERLSGFRPSQGAAAPGVYRVVPGEVQGRLGSNGMELLDLLLFWEPMARPTCEECLAHSWLQLGCLLRGFEGSEPPRVFPGDRHSWTMLEGYMEPEVLAWLRQDVCNVKELKQQCQKKEGEHKWILSGKMVEHPGAGQVNELDVSQWLPLPRLLCWLQAFKDKNASSLAKLSAKAQEAVAEVSELGPNGQDFMQRPMNKWFATVGQLHLFEAPAGLEETKHFDGGASILHMGVTLYGRRQLRFFEGNKARPGEIVADMSLAPGSVYLGTITGGLHQVVHGTPRSAHEARLGHSMTCMVRTSLWPAPMGRIMRMSPKPAPMFAAVAQSFVASLREHSFALPSLAECQALPRVNIEY